MIRKLLNLLGKDRVQKIIDLLAKSYVGFNPFIIAINYTRFGITRQHYLSIVDKLQPGDIILTKHKSCVANWFNTGRVSHAGLYVGDTLDPRFKHGVIQAVQPKVMIQELSSVICCDYVEVWRPINLIRSEDYSKMLAFLKDVMAKEVPYDEEFKSDLVSSEEEANKYYYCSELIVECYQTIANDYGIKFVGVEKLGEMVYSPASFVSLGKGFTFLFCLGEKC